MKKAWILSLAIAIGLTALFFSKKTENRKIESENHVGIEPIVQNYWTCPMHPQIHAEHSGECPICHMKLIQIKQQQGQNTAPTEKREPVKASNNQLDLLGIQRTEVEKMDLKLKIPVSGRFISSSAVAFQIYESDLRYIKKGSMFKGANSFYPEDEVVGVISSVDTIVDPTSRTVRVVGSVQKGARGTLPETGFRADIIVALKDRTAIPESSVLHTGEQDLVYVFLEGNQLKPTSVKLGLKTEGFYDVLAGVDAGQMISSGPNFLIDSESKIRGTSMSTDGSGKSTAPSCPTGQHWDNPMAMCMPGKG